MEDKEHNNPAGTETGRRAKGITYAQCPSPSTFEGERIREAFNVAKSSAVMLDLAEVEARVIAFSLAQTTTLYTLKYKINGATFRRVNMPRDAAYLRAAVLIAQGVSVVITPTQQ